MSVGNCFVIDAGGPSSLWAAPFPSGVGLKNVRKLARQQEISAASALALAVGSLVGDQAVWNSKQACLQVLALSVCLNFPQ